MAKAKVGTGMKNLVEKAKEFRDMQVAAIENQVYENIQPEVREHILRTLERQSKEEARLHELRSDLQDNLENPIPEDEDYGDEDVLDVERGSEAEGMANGGELENSDELDDEQISEPIPTSGELDGGISDTLKIEVDGVTYEAEFSAGDNKIVFINPEAAPEEGGEFGEAGHDEDLEGLHDEDSEGTHDEDNEDFDFDFDSGPEGEFEEDEDEDFDEFKLRKEIHNRIAKKSKTGSKEQVLEEYRQLIRKQLLAELSTNHHDEKKKTVRKVTVEEKLASKNLVPKKYDKKNVLNESEQKELHSRLAQLCNL